MECFSSFWDESCCDFETKLIEKKKKKMLSCEEGSVAPSLRVLFESRHSVPVDSVSVNGGSVLMSHSLMQGNAWTGSLSVGSLHLGSGDEASLKPVKEVALPVGSAAACFESEGGAACGADNGSIFRWSKDLSSVKQLLFHEDMVASLAHRQGTGLVSGSWDKKVALWDLVNETVVKVFSCAGRVHAVDFAGEGALIVSAGEEGVVRAHDARDPKPGAAAATGASWKGFAPKRDPLLCLKASGWSVAAGDETGSVHIFDLRAASAPAVTYKALSGAVSTLSLHDGVVASGGVGRAVHLADAASGKTLAASSETATPLFVGQVTSVTLLSKNTVLAASRDGTVKILRA